MTILRFQTELQVCLNGLKVAMSSFAESEAVFKDRVTSAGLDDDGILKALNDAGFKTLSKFAFSSSYTPGAVDESPFVKTTKDILKRDANLSELASFRRLLHEAFSLVTAEMKQQLERSEEVHTRKLTQPERADLYSRQVQRLNGLCLKGPLEPSDALIDVFCSVYESNRLRFVPWEKYTAKDTELEKESKPEHMFSLDASGKLKIESKKTDVSADTSTEILLQFALQRRDSAWLLNRFHRHSALGCTPYQSLFGRPYKGRVANFGQDMYGISQKKTKYKAQWTRGVWVGKDHADQDMLIIENDKILKSKAVRATGLFWNKNDLVNMEVTPDHLLKIATQTKGVYPVIPPPQCLPPRSDDEAASDPPDDQGGGDSQVPPLIPIPISAKVRRLPIQQRSPLSQQELSQLLFSAGILPEGGDGPTKRILESDDSRRETKQSKVQSYSEKHQATEVLEEREPKQIKTGLQSSPTFAGNIRHVAEYGGVDIYVEPDEDGFGVPHEECFLHLEDDHGAGYHENDDEFFSSEQQENQGPPKLTDE